MGNLCSEKALNIYNDVVFDNIPFLGGRHFQDEPVSGVKRGTDIVCCQKVPHGSLMCAVYFPQSINLLNLSLYHGHLFVIEPHNKQNKQSVQRNHNT